MGQCSGEKHDDARREQQESGRRFGRAREVPVESMDTEHDRFLAVLTRSLDDKERDWLRRAARFRAFYTLFTCSLRPVADSQKAGGYFLPASARIPAVTSATLKPMPVATSMIAMTSP